MHYLGFVIVDEPTNEAVAKAMEDFKDHHWDWYRCGGRWDGFLQGEEEARSTQNGFNFGDQHDCAARNCCKVSDLPADKRPHFFVSDYDYVPREYFNAYERSKCVPDGYGAVLETPHWEERYQKALKDNADKFIVVVDAHN